MALIENYHVVVVELPPIREALSRIRTDASRNV
jgi:hypothetical protein